MSDQNLIEAYNYDTFKRANFEKWMHWDKSPSVGSQAPDFPLWALDESETSLSALWSEYKYLILEFGSFT
jgi:hypothetical protein